MKDPEKLPSLEALGKSIDALHKKVTQGPKSPLQGNAGMAMQLGVELGAGLAVGVGAGLLLDKWLNTSPFMLIICFCLGTAGGVMVLYRTVMANTTNDESNTNDEP